jgi:PAS domain S-box-containing protein
MVLADGQGRIVIVNGHAEKMFGYRDEELVGEPFEKLMPERLRKGHVHHQSDYSSTAQLQPMRTGSELCGLRKDGSEFPIKISRSSLKTHEGTLVSSAIRDITRAAERDSEDHFRLLADAAPLSIWMSGTDKLCTFFNQSWFAFTGRTMEEELGEGWAAGVHPDDLDRCLKTYSTEFDARSEFTMEYRLRRYDGEYRWIVDRGVPRFESGGTFLGYIGSCVDVTDRKLLEQALAEQLNFETILAKLSSALINPPADQASFWIFASRARMARTAPRAARYGRADFRQLVLPNAGRSGPTPSLSRDRAA